jgi:hypothetical protein
MERRVGIFEICPKKKPPEQGGKLRGVRGDNGVEGPLRNLKSEKIRL